MIQIAGGILLAILILALLPFILVGLSWALGIAMLIALTGSLAWLAWTVAQSPEGLAASLIFLGICFIWLAYEVKAKREMKAELDAAKQAARSHQPAPPSTYKP